MKIITKIIIKAIQWSHIYLFTHAKDWQTRSKLVEADFERRLDELAAKDEDWMVRQTLAAQRIGFKTRLLLADDNKEDVIRLVIRKSLNDDKIISRIKARNLHYFDKCLKESSIKEILEFGRFATLSKLYTPTEKDCFEPYERKIKSAEEYGKLNKH